MKQRQAIDGAPLPSFEGFRAGRQEFAAGQDVAAWVVALTNGDRFLYRPTALGVSLRRYRSRSVSEDEVIRLMFHEQQLRYYRARQHLDRSMVQPPVLVQLPGEADEDDSAVEALISAEMSLAGPHWTH